MPSYAPHFSSSLWKTGKTSKLVERVGLGEGVRKGEGGYRKIIQQSTFQGAFCVRGWRGGGVGLGWGQVASKYIFKKNRKTAIVFEGNVI